MRILCLVLLSIVVVVGAVLGGACAWSATIGPMGEKMTKLSETAAATKELSKLTGDHEIIAGKSAKDAGSMIEQGLRGYRVLQFGGAAIVLLNIALLVLAIRRSSQKILIAGAVATVVGVVCFVLAPARALDETMYGMIVALSISVISSALFAWLADRASARVAVAPAR
jgi:hypothetical protein